MTTPQDTQRDGLRAVLEEVEAYLMSEPAVWRVTTLLGKVRRARAALATQQPAAEPAGYVVPFEWGKRESERVVKITRKPQPQYGFTAQAAPSSEASPAGEPDVWPSYIAGIIETYLRQGDPAGEVRAATIAAIIKRRMQFATAPQAERPAVPEGYALVPIEPTQAMIDAWNSSDAADYKFPTFSAYQDAQRENARPTEAEWKAWAKENATKDWAAMIAAAQGGSNAS